MHLLPLLVLLALLALPQAARAAATDPGGPLVYVFVLDGLDGDRVDQGKAPFLSRLLAGREGAHSTLFRESRSIMVAETNPNHTAMATGAYGNRSGIPGNAFALYRPTENGDSCKPTGPVDETKAPTEVSGENANCRIAESFFETVQRGPDAERIVTAGIFGKPKLAKIFASRNVTPGRYDADHLWTPCVQPSEEEPYCKQVPNRVFDEYAVLDSTVMDEVLRTVRDGVAGDGRTFTGGTRRPQLTFVNFPGIDSSGHASGAGAEYDNAIARVDEQLNRFVTQQKALGLWERTTMVVLSDHSMDTTPQAESTSLEARFQATGLSSDDYTIVQNGSAALIYLSDRRDPGRFAKLKAMRAAALAGMPSTPPFGPPAVQALYREPNPEDGGMAETLAARHPAWRLEGERTGDLVVTSQPGTAFNPALSGNHGGPQTRDNLLAVVGGSALVNQRGISSAQDPLFDDTERNPEQAENVDVAPTVMRLLGQPAPAQSEGRILTEAFNTALAPVPPGTTTLPVGGDGGAAGGGGDAACVPSSGFRRATATGAGRGVAFSFARRTNAPVTVDVFQSSAGRVVIGNRRVARFTGRTGSFRWNGRSSRVRDGILFARLRIRGEGGRIDTRRVALERRRGRFSRRPDFYRRESCGAVSSFKLERPVFGGTQNREVDATYRLSRPGRVTVDLLRGTRVVRRLSATSERRANRSYRLRIGVGGLRRGDHRVRIRLVQGSKTTTATLTARKL